MVSSFPAGKENLPKHLAHELTFWNNNSDMIGNLRRYGVYCNLFANYVGKHYRVIGDIGSGPSPFVNWMRAETMVAVDPLVNFYHEIPHWSRFWRMNDIEAYDDVRNLPDAYLDCALLLNLFDHIEPGYRDEYFEILCQKLFPGCIVLVFTHIRVKIDQFHFPTEADGMQALAGKWLNRIDSGVIGQKFRHWSKESWWGVYQHG